MGMMTNVSILNDHIAWIQDNPEEFVRQLVNDIQRGKSNSNNVTVNGVFHTDETHVFVVGGNCTSSLGYVGQNLSHFKKEEQLKIAKTLVKKLK